MASTHTHTFTPGASAEARVAELQQALIDKGVPRRHTISLQAPGMPDFEIGHWPELYCSDADFLLATAVLITWYA
jgi:hypothetical protein